MDFAVPETAAGRSACADYGNPEWTTLLQLPEMDADSVECRGKALRSDGRTKLDLLSGYRVSNAGHNRSGIVDAPHREPARGSHFLLLKVAPPLIPPAETLARFISAINQVRALVHSSTPASGRMPWRWQLRRRASEEKHATTCRRG
jgi:hypothetical protein